MENDRIGMITVREWNIHFKLFVWFYSPLLSERPMSWWWDDSRHLPLLCVTSDKNDNDHIITNGKVLHQCRETSILATKLMFPRRIWKSWIERKEVLRKTKHLYLLLLFFACQGALINVLNHNESVFNSSVSQTMTKWALSQSVVENWRTWLFKSGQTHACANTHISQYLNKSP